MILEPVSGVKLTERAELKEMFHGRVAECVPKHIRGKLRSRIGVDRSMSI